MPQGLTYCIHSCWREIIIIIVYCIVYMTLIYLGARSVKQFTQNFVTKYNITYSRNQAPIHINCSNWISLTFFRI